VENHKQNQKSHQATIEDLSLDELEKKNEFSGFDRQDSTVIIRRLIKELRTTIVIAQALAETVSNMEKNANG
jgi:hypothetical protein